MPEPIRIVGHRALPVRVVTQVGPAGRDGLDGLDGGSYVHEQPIAAGTWSITTPGVFTRPPAVQVMLASGEVVLTDVTSTQINVSVTFAQPTAGRAVLT